MMHYSEQVNHEVKSSTMNITPDNAALSPETPRSMLISISGRTNSGKTTLAVTMAKNAILNRWMVAGNESFKEAFPYPTLDNNEVLDDDHDFSDDLRLAIFDDAKLGQGTELESVIQRLLDNGTHVVTVTQARSDRPVVAITGQMGEDEANQETMELCQMLLGVKLRLESENLGNKYDLLINGSSFQVCADVFVGDGLERFMRSVRC